VKKSMGLSATSRKSTGAAGWMSTYWQLLRPLRIRALALFALSLCGLGLQLPLPFLVADIVNELTRAASLRELAPKIAWVTALSIGALAISTILDISGAHLATRFVWKARFACYVRLQEALPQALSAFDFSDLQARIFGDLNSLSVLLPTGLVRIGRDVLYLMLFGGVLVAGSPRIVACIVGFLPLAALAFRIGSRRLSLLSLGAYRGNATLNATLLEALQGLRESRVIGARSFHTQRLAGALSESRSLGLRAHRHGALLAGVLGLIPIAVAALIWIVGGAEVSNGEMSMGELVSFLMVLSMLYGPINGLFAAASDVVQEQAAMQRVSEILSLSTSTAATPEDGNAVLRDGPLALELQNLCFGYGGQLVIQDLNALVPAGSVAVLLGRNGVGKTTLAELIAGLEQPFHGQILLDGIGMSAIPDAMRRTAIGLMPQNATIFAGTLRTNIALGRDVSDEQITSLASELALDGFLTDWPGGLDGEVGEMGCNLSGGQRQKIGLLRALAHSPRLLVLDEPENNLDAAAVQGVVDYLVRHRGKRTVVVVSHSDWVQQLADVVINLPGPVAHNNPSASGVCDGVVALGAMGAQSFAPNV